MSGRGELYEIYGLFAVGLLLILTGGGIFLEVPNIPIRAFCVILIFLGCWCFYMCAGKSSVSVISQRRKERL